MTTLTMALLLAWRDPARQVALLVGIGSILLIAIAPSSILWACCFVAPAFFLGVVLTLPTFSAFELSLPVTHAQLLWSRVVGSLAILWVPLLVGVAMGIFAGREVRRPVECALLFTASACLFAYARLAPRRAPELAYAAFAVLCAALALFHFTPTMALVVGSAAAFPLLAKVYWTCVSDEVSAPVGPVVGRPVWALLRLTVSWQTLVATPLIFYVGTNQNWSSLVYVGLFLITDSVSLRYCQTLPIARRYVLLGRFAPLVLALLAGTFAPMDADGMLAPDRMLSSELRSGAADWRQFAGQPLGISVPLDYYVPCPAKNPPHIASPWGETAQPNHFDATALFGRSTCLYNPFSISTENSDRFFEWQFARATHAIYGKPLRPAELAAAVRGGLKPVMRQTRMRILDAAFGIGCLLLIAMIAAAHANAAIPNFVRQQILRPFALPLAVMMWLPFFRPQHSVRFDSLAAHAQPLLFRFSAALPANVPLTIAILLVALTALYWMLELLFNGVEFPEKPKETA